MRLGIDFDNTIITYDEVFRKVARERGLIGEDFSGQKQAIRDQIRLLPDGELAWQQLQGFVYGKGIAGARMFDGVDGFLRRCKSEGLSVAIVSHKTEYGHHDLERVNLRQAAREWMNSNGFFCAARYGILPENVHFELTRAKKLERIAALGLTHFIDDLVEVFDDPCFPRSVQTILFSDVQQPNRAAYVVCRTWSEIEEQVFGRP